MAEVVSAAAIREARCEDASGIAQVHVTSWQTTYHGLMPDSFLADLNVTARGRYWSSLLCAPRREQFIYIAEADGQIVGFAAGGAERSGDPIYKSELYAIYLLDSHQRQGLGKHLTLAVAGALASAGFQAMLVWVLAENPSRHFYEKLGGTELRSQLITIGERSYEEVAYGWPDVRKLQRGRE